MFRMRKWQLRLLQGLLAGLALVLALSWAQKKWMPTILAISQMEARGLANQLINDAVSETLAQMDLSSSDLVHRQDGLLFTDTLTVNRLSLQISRRVENEISSLSSTRIKVPLGVVTGIDLLANHGPCLSFLLMEMGETEVTLFTSFSEAGINQTYYRLGLSVTVRLRLVNPLQSHTVTTVRQVLLVETVLQGEVPSGMVTWQP